MLLILIIIFIAGAAVPAFAIDENQAKQYMDKQYDVTGADKLKRELPKGVDKAMEKAGVSSPKPDEIKKLSVPGFFSGLFSQAVEIAKTPLVMLASCLGILILCAMFEAFASPKDSTLGSVLDLVASLSICGVMITPLVGCVQYVSGMVKALSNFMLCFIPVFTGVMATSGCPATAVGYNTSVFVVSELISTIMADILLPFLGVFLALSIAGSMNSEFKISGLTSAVKKTVVFSLTFLVTIYVGLFSMQSMIFASSDGLGMKTAKFLSGSFVPVVGGALSDAMTTVVGCMGLIKSSVGGFGILACIMTFLPPILTVLFFMLMINISGTVAEFFSVKTVPGLMKSVQDAMSILLAFLICFGIIMIVTTSLMLAIGNG